MVLRWRACVPLQIRDRCSWAAAARVGARALASGHHRAQLPRAGRALAGQRPWLRCAAAVRAPQRCLGRLKHARPRVELAWCALARRRRCACCRLRRADGGRCIRAAWRRQSGRSGCARPLSACAQWNAQNVAARCRRACAALRPLVRPARCWGHLAAWVALDARAGAAVALKRSWLVRSIRWQLPLLTWTPQILRQAVLAASFDELSCQRSARGRG